MNDEIWKPIKGFEGYYKVSNCGRAKSVQRIVKNSNTSTRIVKERILKSAIGSHGYLAVRLSKNGKTKVFTIHVLVATAFKDHIPNGHKIVVDHIDGNKLNNYIDNIQLITHRKNLSKDKSGYSSKYIGVCRDKTNNKWMASIGVGGKNKHLGRFDNELDAYKAYKNALKQV